MRRTVVTVVEFAKKVLKNCAIGRLIYEPLHKIYRLYSVPVRRRMLRRNGRLVLQKLAEVFKKYDIPAFAAYGTLLGFYREHGFIAHDDDIDIGVMANTIRPSDLLRILVEKEGLEFVFAFAYDGMVTEFKVRYAGVPVDFFFYAEKGGRYESIGYYYYPNIKYPDDRANSVQRLVEPKVSGLVDYCVFDVDFPIPANVEDVLAGLYGPSWRIPDAKWDEAKQHPGRIDLDGFGYRCDYEDVRETKEV